MWPHCTKKETWDVRSVQKSRMIQESAVRISNLKLFRTVSASTLREHPKGMVLALSVIRLEGCHIGIGILQHPIALGHEAVGYVGPFGDPLGDYDRRYFSGKYPLCICWWQTLLWYPLFHWTAELDQDETQEIRSDMCQESRFWAISMNWYAANVFWYVGQMLALKKGSSFTYH